MNRIQYAISLRETGNASGKAKRDAYTIALNMGFSPNYKPSDERIVRIIQQIITMPVFRHKDVVFCQYPAISKPLLYLFDKVVTSNTYKIALVHDLLSIQGFNNLSSSKEVKLLNSFDCLIVHNSKMDEYVRRIGYKGQTIELGIFDYLHDITRPVSNKLFSNTISFAGNLEKARFINHIDRINCNWLLYGKTVEGDFMHFSNANYMGLLPSDEIPYIMEGDYGLVWDGDSVESCSGPNGKYLEFNNPHKLSCVIASGKPVITWKKAAIARFVENNSIGITVDSLMDLNSLDLENNYDQMRNNVLRIKKAIGEGYYLKTAIEKSLIIK